MPLQAVPRAAVAARKVLIVDDQADVREALRLLLKGAGYAIETAESPKDALAAAAYRDQDLIVLDMNYTWDTTSGEEGLHLIDSLRAQSCDVPIIAMTGWSTIELAVAAMHRGAADFIPKPWDNRQFLATVEKHLNSEPPQRRMQNAELAIARKVQRKLLPQPRFEAYGLECECAFLPVHDLSGDLYDFFEIDSSHMAFLLGDVSGKGVGAALLMANLQATIRGQQQFAESPALLVERVNRFFFESTRPEHFATLLFATYNARSKAITYVNCGHPGPVLIRENATCEVLEPTGMVLGAFSNAQFQQRSFEFLPGDRLFLFSDGFSEAGVNGDDDTDSYVRLICSVAAERSTGLAGILASNAASRGGEADDITVVEIRAM
jgi:sigma-B regulation protein RsbU (phosphoserine phosphatase)